MISDFLALYEFLKKNADEFLTLGAVFDERGVRVEGDKEVEVEIIEMKREDVWFYRVNPYSNYVFVPIPAIPCRIEFASTGKNLTTEIFRFTFTNLSSETRPNLLVSFSIIGYQPSQMLDKLKAKN
jgi:hypothetical protein